MNQNEFSNDGEKFELKPQDMQKFSLNIKKFLYTRTTILKFQVFLSLMKVPVYHMTSTSYEVTKNTTIIEKHINLAESSNEESLISYQIRSSTSKSLDFSNQDLDTIHQSYSKLEANSHFNSSYEYPMKIIKETIKQSLKVQAGTTSISISSKSQPFIFKILSVLPATLLILLILYIKYKKLLL